MKKTLVILCTAVLLLCALQEGTKAQEEISPISPTVRVIERGAPDMTEAEKNQLTKDVLERVKWKGNSPANPILPYRWVDIESGGRTYIIKVAVRGTRITIWIDPVIAVGYDYSIEKGPKVTAVELPTGIGDNIFDLWVYDEKSKSYMDSGVNIEGGKLYTFNEPVEKFAIRGIETDAEVDAKNGTAFPTGLRFEKTGKAIINMTSIPAPKTK